MFSPKVLDAICLAVLIAIAGAVAMFAFTCIAAKAAEPHHHPEADRELHEKFYSTWQRPDTPTISCCSLADCYRTTAKHEGGRWFAKRREDGAWLPIPEEKIERKREMPDHNTHLCAPPPNHPYYPADHVFCFGYSSGI